MLSGAQAARLADLLPAHAWPRALGLAALILLEAVLPLTALLACVEINVASIRTSRTERGEEPLNRVDPQQQY